MVISPDNTDHNAIIGAYTNNLSVGVELHHYGLRAATTTADGSTVLDTNQKLMLDAKGTGDVLIQTYGGTGHVGIGTNSPGYTLEVKKTVDADWVSRIYNTSTNAASYGLLVRSDNSAAAASNFGVHNGTKHTFAVKGDGRVGIGTDTPTFALEVIGGAETAAWFRGTSNDTTILIGNTAAGKSGEQYITYANNTTWTSAWMVGMDDDEKFKFCYGLNGELTDALSKVTIQQNGNVGIGTVAPGALLNLVSSTTNEPVLLLENTNADNTPPFLDFFKNSASAADDDYLGKIQFKGKTSTGAIAAYADIYAVARDITNTTKDGNLYLRTLVDNTMENSVFIGLGKVGIGTSAPTAKLESWGAAAGSVFKALTLTNDARPSSTLTGTGVKIEFNTADAEEGPSTTAFIQAKHTAETFNASAVLQFSAGNTGAIHQTIQSDGNVGIGDPAPDAKLRVYGGDVKLSYSAGSNPFTLRAINDAFWMIGDGAATQDWVMSKSYAHDYAFHFKYTPGTTGAGAGIMKIGQQSKNHANYTHGITAFYTNGLERMRIAANGAIQFNSYGSGTHTGTSAYKLSVDSSGNIIETDIGAGAVDGAGTAGYIPKWTDSDTIGDSIMSGTSSTITVTNAAGGWNTGLVSINTNADSSPSMILLHKQSASPADNDYIGGFAFKGRNSANQDHNYVEQWAIATDITDGSESSKWHIGTWGSGTEYPNTLVAREGEVGIGTGSPVGLLDVYSTGSDPMIVRSTSTSRATLSIRSGSTGDAQVRFQNSAASKWTIGNDGGDSNKFKIAVGSGAFAASEAVIIDTSGNLSILGTLTEASSLTIKENIETYSPSLEMISKIRPVRFNKKKSKKKEVGLVAEELAEMFPELVETDSDGKPSGVNYSRAVAVLLHGFKELYKEVKELKEKI